MGQGRVLGQMEETAYRASSYPSWTPSLFNATQLISEGDIVSELHIVIEGEVEVCAFGAGGDASRRSNASRKGGGDQSKNGHDGSKTGGVSKSDGSKYGRNNGSSKRGSMNARSAVNRSNRSATNPSFSVAKSGNNSQPSPFPVASLHISLSGPPAACASPCVRTLPHK